MKIQQYQDVAAFAADVQDLLLEKEEQNNLPLGLLQNAPEDTGHWLMYTVKEDGQVVLTAMCTPPFNIVLYETGNQPAPQALQLLAQTLKAAGTVLPGVLAQQDLARRFAEIYAGAGRYKKHMSMHIMKLKAVLPVKHTPGKLRLLQEEDLFFAPYWEKVFADDCRIPSMDISGYVQQLEERIQTKTHYIWQDEIPVSQLSLGRRSKNGAVISSVYTPPQYRGKGYATAAVAALSQKLLQEGFQFCCLFADADNPISCGIYQKIGYQNQCIFDELEFDAP